MKPHSVWPQALVVAQGATNFRKLYAIALRPIVKGKVSKMADVKWFPGLNLEDKLSSTIKLMKGSCNAYLISNSKPTVIIFSVYLIQSLLAMRTNVPPGNPDAVVQRSMYKIHNIFSIRDLSHAFL